MKPQTLRRRPCRRRARAGIATIGGLSRSQHPDDDGAEGAQQELALGADVEQAGLERQADRQAAEDQRRRGDERIDDRVEARRPSRDERGVGLEGEPGLELAGDQPLRQDDDDRPDDDRQDDRDERQREDAPTRAPERRSCRGPSVPRRHVRGRRWPSGCPTSFLSAVRPSMTATIRPRYMTATRSDSSRTSSSSAETSRMAVPASRLAIACRWMNSMLPTSRPRVGWSRTSSRRSRSNSRATTTFCWLPPDSVAAVARRPTASGCRTPRSVPRPSARSPRRCAGCPGCTAGGGTSSGRGCPRPGTTGRGRTGGGRPGRRRRRPRRSSRVPLPGDVGAIERDRAAGRLAQADERLDELVLAVAGDPGDARGSRRPGPRSRRRGRPRGRGRP